MAPEVKRLKTQTLSLRLDPKTRFILEFIARLRGQSITTIVERAIKESADKTLLAPTWIEGEEISQRNWLYFWDPSEGVRTLKLLADPEYPTTFEEDELRQFTLAHCRFFYQESEGRNPKRGYVDLLWPRITEFMENWRSTKKNDYWAAGKEMKAALSAAGVKPPEWPPQSKPNDQGKPRGDLDDEIPF